MQKALAIIGIVLLVVAGAFLGWWLRGFHPVVIEPEVQVDTVWKHDTSFVEKPVPIEVTPKGYELVPAGTIDLVTKQIKELEDSLERKPRIVIRDSLIYIDVPMEQKHYGDSTYDAWVSGYHPALDSLAIYQSTAIVERAVYQKVKRKWGIGVNAGWGVMVDPFGEKATVHTGPTISVGVNYNF